MTETYVSINGTRVTELRLRASNVGPWFVEADLESDADVPSAPMAAKVEIGALKLVGTVDAGAVGTFGLQTKLRIVGGAGAWSKFVTAKGYHNDAGVKARTVADDLARELGETLGRFVPARERLGRDYARPAGPASTVLEDIVNGAPWWVGYDGLTNVGPRPASTAAPGSYEVTAYDARSKIATIALDDPGAVRVGSILSERLDGPQTVRELELRVTPDEMRMSCWCGGSEAAGGMLADLLRSIARRSTDGQLFGVYRYRVVKMAGDRVELQAVSKLPGLPDLLPLSMWPGVAGVHADLAASAEVLVTFIEGDRAQPVVTGFSGKDGVGFAPTVLELGGGAGPEAGRKGDTVEVLLPPAVLSGTALIGGVPTPITGALTFLLGKALGQLTSGSAKVRIA